MDTGVETKKKKVMKEEFVFRTYGKTELAMAYAQGDMSERTALNWLNREIKQYPGLLERLEALGYRPGQRVVTIAQLHVLVECIGVP